ncbi:MAG: hypothetical protein EB127_08210 [Alphaproteobacteria bacterium]|nr:hypothetical protein [Alphaproteobacteria bacterium]
MKFDKLVNLYLENIAGSPGSGHNHRMKNKEMMNSVRKHVNNWVAGAEAGDFGIDDLIDVLDAILRTFGSDAWDEIDMTLQGLVDDNVIEQDERKHIVDTLLEEFPA